jgi:hypothetical protein
MADGVAEPQCRKRLQLVCLLIEAVGQALIWLAPSP